MSNYTDLISRLNKKTGPINLSEIIELLEKQTLPADALAPGSASTTVVEAITQLPIDATTGRELTYFADRYDRVFGREYLSAWHKALMAGSTVTAVLTGDSTTAGTSVTTPYKLHTLLSGLFASYFVGGTITWSNRGQGGQSAGDWQSSYLAGDLALSPSLMIIRWGINDPTDGHTANQYLTIMGECLASIRASRTFEQCSLVLMTPNTISDDVTGRNELWNESITAGLRELARQYRCCFIDTYGLWRDARNAADYMDEPYGVGEGRHIHPLDVFNVWISSLLFDVLAPVQLRSNGGIASNTGGTLATSAAPSTFTKPLQIDRAQPANGWTYDGAVVTLRQANGVWLQLNFPYAGSTSRLVFRTSTSSGSAWNGFVNAGIPIVTGSGTLPSNGPGQFPDGVSVYRATVSPDGWPLDGTVVTIRNSSTNAIQFLHPFQSSSTQAYFRCSLTSTTWGDWTYLGTPVIKTTSAITNSTLPSSFQLGTVVHRALTTDSFPNDGAVLTIKYSDTATLQINFGYANDVSKFSFRSVQNSTTWGAWRRVGGGGQELFTPVVAGVTVAGTHTYAEQLGYFFRNGDMATFNIRVKLSTKDVASSGNLKVTGLPVANGSTNVAIAAIPRWGGVTLAANYTSIGGIIQSGATEILIQRSGSGVAAASVAMSDASDSLELYVTGTYYIG